jgi:hypothetical protein
MREVADAMVSKGLRDAGYTYVNIDDGWGANDRNGSGCIVAHATKFPNGMRPLADYVHGLNMSFGLYTARATRTCGNKMPGSLGNEVIDAQTFAEYGADFLKNDDCHTVYADSVQDYGAMQAAIAAAPRPMLHNAKAPDLPAASAAGVCQFRRVGKDLKNSWENLVRVLDTGTDRAFSDLVVPGVGNGYFNDLDMLEIGGAANVPAGETGLTDSEQVAHFSLWAALKSPLVLGNDPRKMTAAALAIVTNREVLAVNQDTGGEIFGSIQAVKISATCSATPPTDTGAGAGAGAAFPAKAALQPCDAADVQQHWVVDAAAGRVRSASQPGLCLGVYQCLTRWPWWMSVEPCAPASASAPTYGTTVPTTAATNSTTASPSCSAADQQSLAVDRAAGTIAWHPRSTSKIGSCWPSAGQCCLSAEGANPELDSCGWALDASQQRWGVRPVARAVAGAAAATAAAAGGAAAAATAAAADTAAAVQISSVHSGQCLSKCADLEVFAGPLSGSGARTDAGGARQATVAGATATVVLFNRSPAPANISVAFADLHRAFGFKYIYEHGAEAEAAGEGGSSLDSPLVGGSLVEVRDLWAGRDRGAFAERFTAEVAPHSVVHVNLSPQATGLVVGAGTPLVL